MINHNYHRGLLMCILSCAIIFSFDCTDKPTSITQGTALIIRPRTTITNISSTFSVEIYLEGADSLMGIHVELDYDQHRYYYSEILLDYTLFTSNNGSSIPNSYFGDTTFVLVDTINGTIDINMIRIGGDPPYVSGSGKIATLEFHAVEAGTTSLAFIETEFRNQNNRDLSLNYELFDGMIIIE